MTTQDELLERIGFNPNILGGKPIIRGMRIAVEHVLGFLAAGMSPDDILRDYEILEPEDIHACLVYAHRSIRGEQVFARIKVAEPAKQPIA